MQARLGRRSVDCARAGRLEPPSLSTRRPGCETARTSRAWSSTGRCTMRAFRRRMPSGRARRASCSRGSVPFPTLLCESPLSSPLSSPCGDCRRRCMRAGAGATSRMAPWRGSWTGSSTCATTASTDTCSLGGATRPRSSGRPTSRATRRRSHTRRSSPRCAASRTSCRSTACGRATR